MTGDDELPADSAEELFEDAPCGYVTTRLDGTIVRVNRTFEQWTGYARGELLGERRLQDLLTAGGRIYHETHYAPLLRMQGAVREIALDVVRADGSRLPVLVNSVLQHDDAGQPRAVRTTIFDATDRRRYERELVRARERERGIALELQRSLLSGALPADERLGLQVAYHPAVRGLEVGGDWFDAFALDDSRVGLVIGDVVGRGIEAAATMGQLRSAIRALASVGGSPAEILERLEGYARRHDVGHMATVVYADLDLATGALRYACAGHPPPAVAEPGRPPRLLMGGRSLPLAAFAVSPPRPEGAAELAPGGVVVLYTDGLIERRDRSLQSGLDRLLEELGRFAGDSDLADELMRTMLTGETHPDDVCILAATLRPGG